MSDLDLDRDRDREGDRKRNRPDDDTSTPTPDTTRVRMFVMTFIYEDGHYDMFVTKFDNLTNAQVDAMRELDGQYGTEPYSQIYRELDDQGLWYKEIDGETVQNEIWIKVDKIKDAITGHGQYLELEDIVTYTAWC